MTNKEAIEGVVEAVLNGDWGDNVGLENVLRTEVSALLAEAEARGRNEAVDAIDRGGFVIRDLQVRDGKLNVVLDKLPEGESVILISDKVLTAARQSENSEGNGK